MVCPLRYVLVAASAALALCFAAAAYFTDDACASASPGKKDAKARERIPWHTALLTFLWDGLTGRYLYDVVVHGQTTPRAAK